MRILLDECVDWRLLRDLPEFDVKTVRQMGWTGTANGALLRLAQQHFDVFITVEKNLWLQQNFAGLKIAVVVLRGPSTRLAHLRRLVPSLIAALPGLRPGDVRVVEE